MRFERAEFREGKSSYDLQCDKSSKSNVQGLASKVGKSRPWSKQVQVEARLSGRRRVGARGLHGPKTLGILTYFDWFWPVWTENFFYFTDEGKHHTIGFPKPAADGFPFVQNALSRKAGQCDVGWGVGRNGFMNNWICGSMGSNRKGLMANY